jgi:hypothetical protein
MSNLLAIETPVALLQSGQIGAAGNASAKTATAADIIAGRGAGAATSNRVGDDILLATQGKLNNIRIIKEAISGSQGPLSEDGELKGAKAEGAYFSYGPVMDANAANELINLSKSQILNMPSALVATGQPAHAVLGLIR